MVGVVLQARDGGLRAQIALERQALQSHLAREIAAQAVSVVAVLVTRRNGQQAEADDVSQWMQGACGIARFLNAVSHPFSHTEPLSNFTQHQQPSIGGQTAAIGGPDHRLPGNG